MFNANQARANVEKAKAEVMASAYEYANGKLSADIERASAEGQTEITLNEKDFLAKKGFFKALASVLAENGFSVLHSVGVCLIVKW
jgi:hypothetical protein